MDSFKQNILQFNRQLTNKNLKRSDLERLKGSNPDAVIVIGIGGSTLTGDLLRAVRREIGLKVPVVVWKDYGLPALSEVEGPNISGWRIKNPLYVFVSFSGNTEEPLSGIKMLLKSKKKSLVAAVSSGGQLYDLARTHRLPLVSFPAHGLTPRQATGSMFYSVVAILRAAGFPVKVSDYTRLDPKRFLKSGQALAKKLRNRLIVIYTDSAHDYLGYIWKIKFNETAKTPAFNNVLPEMDHNEINAFARKSFPVTALFLSDATHHRLGKKFALTQKLLKEKGVSVLNLKLKGNSELEKTWRGIILADWTTYFLAKLNRVDPAKTEIIERLKKLMG